MAGQRLDGAVWEYHQVSFPRGTDRGTAARTLAIHAEFGEWEIDRSQLWPDGRRRVVLRRKRRRISALPVPVAT